ncbi:hypothetical protein CIPAW_08G023100 [Carya illinoinensis]|uniref:Uncharacterized protein n=1 Tax=Carya illinoinensis TaxID=32201 RepID=A0A8T1PM30_CARIL|nr:hypothetical protein CIPAW_08G023100 [Carya illinoinensis]KAG6698510.1 hypothetical protein I3842_08G023400 [Carya illinoinensis]
MIILYSSSISPETCKCNSVSSSCVRGSYFLQWLLGHSLSVLVNMSSLLVKKSQRKPWNRKRRILHEHGIEKKCRYFHSFA